MGIFDGIIRGVLLGRGVAGNAISPITQFYNALKRYPGNNKQWWVAKAQSDDKDKNIKEGDFLPLVLDKVFSGNNRAPRGHFLLNAFRRNRSNASGVAGLPLEDNTRRAQANCFFAGRAWWAAGSEVYYSQIVNHRSKAGLCYQEADPTSEDISDLIASDGGHVPIPEARNIQRMMSLSNGIIVFAINGVWFISGGNNGFSATGVSLTKVSSTGTKNPMSIVAMGDSIMWWSEVGIHALEQAQGQFGPIPGKFGNTNIAEQTIQSFYNKIPENSKAHAKAIYDPKANTVSWLFSDPFVPYEYNKVLIYDVTLQAFYPWKVSQVTDGPRIIGHLLDNGLISSEIKEDITTNTGELVTTISLDKIETSVYNTTVETRPTNLNYLTNINSNITFSKFDNPQYADWQTFNGVGAAYTSFVETGFELLEDAMRKKQAVRVFIHFRRTEDDPLGVATSCKFRTKWEWSANSGSNRWSREIEAYRPRIMRVPTTADFASGFPVVISNNKVRGSGKAVQFRFECNEANKNFDLLGWSVAYAGNTEP